MKNENEKFHPLATYYPYMEVYEFPLRWPLPLENKALVNLSNIILIYEGGVHNLEH